MEYFFVEGLGYIAFVSFKHWFWARKSRQIVLADPVCAPEKMLDLLTLFLKKYPNPVFVQSSRRFAEILDNEGFQVNQFGIETELPTVNFDLSGKARAKLRQWRNKCQREGVLVTECAINDCANTDDIKALSNRWLAKKGGGEYSFLVRPLRYQNEKGVRYFWAYQSSQKDSVMPENHPKGGGVAECESANTFTESEAEQHGSQQKLIGLAVFDPIYKDNKVIGYYHNIDRIDDMAPHGTSATIVLHALEVFRKEGVDKISLGMSPLRLQKGLGSELNFNLFTRKSFWYAFEKFNFIYPFKGNASHKAKFNGEISPVYFSSTKGTGLWQVFVMLRAIGMF